MTCDGDGYPASFVLNQLAWSKGRGRTPIRMSDFRDQNPLPKRTLWTFITGTPAENKPPTQADSIAWGVFKGLVMFAVVSAVVYWFVLLLVDSGFFV